MNQDPLCLVLYHYDFSYHVTAKGVPALKKQ